eukprot:445574-Hanusia_phi.AAC.4
MGPKISATSPRGDLSSKQITAPSSSAGTPTSAWMTTLASTTAEMLPSRSIGPSTDAIGLGGTGASTSFLVRRSASGG